ncbi:MULTISPECIES: DUF3861 domain-containing protein [Mesoflavibacter]|uniref:DUF3861 domain-containing protein n=1 Tax=Mesoflavibacter profundi TaxID=2708110 RepID=A0ABT4S1X1_9FLAO|nr:MULTISPECIES: DUF3861 domain-containing protein [Mesoflavibacter]MDA0178073.1 DUF3861 domain-containing protein [Mesoflavibacter profundi]QIJ89034.1 hypothetical protein C7H62_1225 [Mesoflavibacter sp. HG96]QIJ91762.1 hypothetical protein C7H56_1225 [Mesoflavibacter sp. HG37]
MKKTNTYKITLEEVELKDESNPSGTLQFEFENHDNILQILDRIQQKNIFDDATNKEFVVGLKLFSEVVIKNRKHPLFNIFLPHFGDFMKQLKSY